jgi:tetratricopeptide (TPR) repeat protein
LAATDERPLLPLYVEQVEGLGLSLTGIEAAPSKLADVVAQRVQRLHISARRALQCAAVLGYRCSRSTLATLAGKGNDSVLESLREQGFILIDGENIEIVHPFIRDLIEAFIPAEARRELHGQAYRLTTEQGAPLEVRAGHAYRTGEAFGALMILEQMGNVAAGRGDFDTAALAYQRGLELARQELLETGDPILDVAVVTFSCKLGDALTRSGDAIGAEGVLREALGLTEPISRHRAQMMVGLSKVVAMRKRFRDAFRLLDQTLEVARKLKSDDIRVESYLGVAWVRNEQGDKRGQADALKAASDLLSHMPVAPLERAAIEVELASVWVEAGESDKAYTRLDHAEPLARQAEAPHLLGKISLLLGQLAARIGEKARARDQFRRAMAFAAQAGDAETVQACEGIVAALDADAHASIEVVALDQSAARADRTESPTQALDRSKDGRMSKGT